MNNQKNQKASKKLLKILGIASTGAFLSCLIPVISSQPAFSQQNDPASQTTGGARADEAGGFANPSTRVDDPSVSTPGMNPTMQQNMPQQGVGGGAGGMSGQMNQEQGGTSSPNLGNTTAPSGGRINDQFVNPSQNVNEGAGSGAGGVQNQTGQFGTQMDGTTIQQQQRQPMQQQPMQQPMQQQPDAGVGSGTGGAVPGLW